MVTINDNELYPNLHNTSHIPKFIFFLNLTNSVLQGVGSTKSKNK
jgi:hypothetical protein